jgi:hypothetical protein
MLICMVLGADLISILDTNSSFYPPSYVLAKANPYRQWIKMFTYVNETRCVGLSWTLKAPW